jgi:hypothetical protein
MGLLKITSWETSALPEGVKEAVGLRVMVGVQVRVGVEVEVKV